MLARSMFDHHLWQEQRVYSRAEAWLDLLKDAAFDPHKRLIAGHTVEIPRGGIVASVRFLSLRWKWSNTKVCLFLDSLECEGMIRREKRHGNTIIILCNYEKYNTEKRRKHAKETSPERQRGDEVEEGKEGKEGTKGKRSPSSKHECEEFCREQKLLRSDGEWFWNKGLSSGWKNGGKPIADWKATIRAWKAQLYFPSQKQGVAPIERKDSAEKAAELIASVKSAGGFAEWLQENYHRNNSPETTPETVLMEFLEHRRKAA